MNSPFGSHRRHSLAASLIAGALLVLAFSCEAMADDPVEIALELHPARIDPFAAPLRLLPADPDLKPGNAAVVLNGLMAERQGLWSAWDTIYDDARLPVSAPRIAATEVAGIIQDSKNPLTPEQRADLILRCAPLARERLVRRGILSADAAMAISPEAAVMRAILDHHATLGRQMRLAWTLPPSEAIGQLAKLDGLAGAWDLELDSWPLANGFVKDFLFFNHFSRCTAMLETVESLRHHAATHDGELPLKLADLEYAAQRDTVAGLPFLYVRGESPSTASLSMPDIPGVPNDAQQRRTYKIEMVSP